MPPLRAGVSRAVPATLLMLLWGLLLLPTTPSGAHAQGQAAERDTARWFSHSDTTRLLIAPTARTLPRGRGYVAVHEIFFPTVAFGLTDRITVAGGMSLFPTTDIEEQFVYVMPKIGLVSRPGFALSVGALAMRFGLGDPDPETFGIVYALGTFGGAQGSVTTGVGYGFAGGGLAKSPAFQLGGDKRLRDNFSVVTENYVFPDGFDGALVSGAGRFLLRRGSIDVGLAGLVGVHSTRSVLPYIGFLVNF